MPKAVNSSSGLIRSQSFCDLKKALPVAGTKREVGGANSLRLGIESPGGGSRPDSALSFGTLSPALVGDRPASALSVAPTRSGSVLGFEPVRFFTESPVTDGAKPERFLKIRESDGSSDEESSDEGSIDGELFGDEFDFSNKDPFDLNGGQSETQRNLPDPIASRLLDEVISNMAIREESGGSSDDEFAQPFKRRRK